MHRRSFLSIGAAGLAAPAMSTTLHGRSPDACSEILSGVHENPGEGPPRSQFHDATFLARERFTGQVLNDFGFLQTAVTLATFDPRITPVGSKAYEAAEARARVIDDYIDKCHRAGLEAFVWTDLIVLPKTVRALWGAEVLNAQGQYSFSRPKLVALHRAMFAEIAARFPKLDGVVVRTGEAYFENTPFHEGNTPFPLGDRQTSGWDATEGHSLLIGLLREAFCERGVKVVYRTWGFGGIHTEPSAYLRATDPVPPHPKLLLSIKHTKGDFHRKYPFNPTLGIGRHPQIVEVQCQREYEGKGAHPNYIAQGVIDGFEEFAGSAPPQGLKDLVGDPRFKGVWAWPRGGGWKGPYIANEFWCALNALVLARWAADPQRGEAACFEAVLAEDLRVAPASRRSLRKIALLSAQGVLRGRSSLIAKVNEFWIRDEFMGGLTPPQVLASLNAEQWGSLNKTFDDIIAADLVEPVLAEKAQAVDIWRRIEALAKSVSLPAPDDEAFVRVSCAYGRIKYEIIAQAWTVMLLGRQSDVAGHYPADRMRAAIARYDALWSAWRDLAKHRLCPSLYKPYAFNYPGPVFQRADGMQASVDHYRGKIG